MEAFDFSLGGGFSGVAVLLFDVEVGEELFEGVGLFVSGASSG